ncbi:RusA family crossover junction endodeoxyribonuclease [Weissella tructae]
MAGKIFEALIELQNDFGSGNDLQHNTRTNVVYRGDTYRKYKNELIQHLNVMNVGEHFDEDTEGLSQYHGLEDMNKLEYKGETLGIQISPEDELAVNLIFYQTNVNQLKRSTKDLDNMIKPTLDAMQEALDFDDAQITKLTAQKMTHFTRSLRIEIWKA